jgi:RNA polymerase-binding transcription factor DksA
VISLTFFEQSIRIRLMALRETLGRSELEGGGLERVRAEIAEIDAALSRLSEGTFGRCQNCGRALGTQRLLAEPTARYCHGGDPCGRPR